MLKLTFTELHLFPSANRLLRQHWSGRKKMKESLQWLIKEKTKERIKGQVIITYSRHAVKLMDWDNHCSSFKIVGDALVANGVIEEDKPEVVVEFIPKQLRVRKKKEERIEILIEPINHKL